MIMLKLSKTQKPLYLYVNSNVIYNVSSYCDSCSSSKCHKYCVSAGVVEDENIDGVIVPESISYSYTANDKKTSLTYYLDSLINAGDTISSDGKSVVPGCHACLPGYESGFKSYTEYVRAYYINYVCEMLSYGKSAKAIFLVLPDFMKFHDGDVYGSRTYSDMPKDYAIMTYVKNDDDTEQFIFDNEIIDNYKKFVEEKALSFANRKLEIIGAEATSILIDYKKDSNNEQTDDSSNL